jgi:hypothetical protein
VAEATASDFPRGRKAAQRGAATMTLKDFILSNYPLLAAVGAFTALATFVSNNALGQPWLATYLRFLFIVAATVLALELVAQLSPELRLDRVRVPAGTPWRLAAFAYVGELAMLGVILNIYWQHPRLLLPTLALAIGVLLWQVVVPQRARGWPGTSVIVAVVALLVAELVFTLLWKEQTLLDWLWGQIR